MRMLFASAAAMALMAGNASAFDWTSVDYGHDAAAWWAVESSAEPLCLSGDSAAGVSSNADVTPGENGQGGTVVETDGTVVFDLQSVNNTIQAAEARVESEHAQCNTTYTLNIQSQNGGLLHEDGNTASLPFLSLIPYDVRASFDGLVLTTAASGATGGGVTSGASSGPGAGTFRIRLNVDDYNNRLMVAGDYADFLKVTISPSP